MDVVESNVEIASMFADQLFPAVAQTNAGLTVDVDDAQLFVEQEEGVRRVVDEGAEARLACAQIVLGTLAFGDIAHDR